MNDPKKYLRQYHENLRNLILRLGIKLRVLEFLDNVGADDQDRKVKNELGVFFDHIDEALRTDIIVTLHALFDERRSKGKGNWIDYLEKTKEYLPGIMGQSVSAACLEALRKEIDLQIGSIRVMKPVINSIKFARDKKYAHFDEKYFDKPEALATDKPLPFPDVVKLVDLCKDILNRH